MIPDLNTAISKSKKLLEGKTNFVSFHSFSPNYLWTTEEIKYYLEHTEFQKDRALTVIGSGDQIFNLVYYGVFMIDGFDLNQLAYFLFHLKRAAILAFSFKEFCSLEVNSFWAYDLYSFELLLKQLKSYLPNDVYEYYQTILQFQKDLPVGPHHLVSLYRNLRCTPSCNIYFSSEENYQITKRNLSHVNVNLIFDDINVIPRVLDPSYDLILLSNIFDYSFSFTQTICDNVYLDAHSSLQHFIDYTNPFYELLKENGVLINYFIHRDPAFLGSLSQMQDWQLFRTFNGESYALIRKK